MAAVITGPVGIIVAVFIDRVMIFFFGLFVWILRRQAPIKHQMRTSWIDQSPLIALLIGLVLCAFSIPAFYPPQLSVRYGYADSVVAAASRLGWVFAPVGVLLALAIMRT
ncbi:MAG: hypothetical protein WEA35_06870 [Candidatus Nanopelagicales bacterium]